MRVTMTVEVDGKTFWVGGNGDDIETMLKESCYVMLRQLNDRGNYDRETLFSPATVHIL